MKQLSVRLLALMLCFLMIASSGAVITTQAVDAVKNLKVDSVTQDGISLSWTSVNKADGYRVFRYELSEKKWKAVKTTKALSYVDSDVEPAEAYYYLVRAYEYVGSEAVFSTNSNTVKAIVPPEKVTGLKAVSATETSVSLKWDEQKGVTGYLVYVYNPATKKYQKKATVSSNSYVLSGLSQGKSYKIAVKSYVDHGAYAYGDFSSILTVSTQGPQVPTNLKAATSPSKGEIKLSWKGSAANSGYIVYSYDAATGVWKQLTTTKGTSYTVTGITETATYIYAVSSYIVSGSKTTYSEKSDSITVYFKKATSSDDLYSPEMNQKGIFGYLFDPIELCFYTAADPWQRTVGYNPLFDILAPFTFINFDTVRLDFLYKEKDWRIQLWKGQYGLLFYGAEVGVYTKPADRKLDHYNSASDEEMLMMEMTFQQKGTLFNKEKWVDKFSRPYDSYWWCTGFIPGYLFGNFERIKLDMRITAKDYEMLSGLTAALKANGMDYTTKGLDVYFVYE